MEAVSEMLQREPKNEGTDPERLTQRGSTSLLTTARPFPCNHQKTIHTTQQHQSGTIASAHCKQTVRRREEVESIRILAAQQKFDRILLQLLFVLHFPGTSPNALGRRRWRTEHAVLARTLATAADAVGRARHWRRELLRRRRTEWLEKECVSSTISSGDGATLSSERLLTLRTIPCEQRHDVEQPAADTPALHNIRTNKQHDRIQ